MKTVIALIFTILFKIAISVSCIWALVEFILYLAKDNPFNWWSVGAIVASFVFAIISGLLTAVAIAKDEDDWKMPKPRASFRDKLRQMAEERSKEKYN